VVSSLREPLVSNHTFLYTTPKPEKPLFGKCPAKGDLLMAAMSIPVFWYMLFDKKSLKLGPDPDEPEKSYLHMTAPTEEALKRAESRWPDVVGVLGKVAEPLFRAFCGFVRDKANKYVHCETMEWYWMFESHAKFEKELHTCLDAFQHYPKRQGDKLKLNKWWDNLLAQAHVDTQYGFRPLGNLSYCGFASNYPVPWSEDHEDGLGCMNKKLRDAKAVGKKPEEIRAYLERWCGLEEFRVAQCECGSRLFRLKYHHSGAQRTCASCGAEHLICDSDEYWESETPKEWECPKCHSNVANFGVGFTRDHNGWVDGLSIGHRCGKCGTIGCNAGWECAAHEEIYEQV
jgi:hypothetical protein